MMLIKFVRLAGWFTILVLSANNLGWAQFGLGKHKESNTTPEKAAELSDEDKKKLAEIEQRPEVKDRIETAWNNRRIYDMDYAYIVNSSTHLGDLSAFQSVEFRQQYGQLYNNPMFQGYINRIGQSLVPQNSPNVYSFKLLLDPIPRAEALSTGTIYVSTGLVSLLDNEAQLAYVLAHEIAHVENKHAYNAIKETILEEALNQEREKSANQKRGIITAVAAGVGAGLGGLFGGKSGVIGGLELGGLGGFATSLFTVRDRKTTTEWTKLNENEADEAGFNYMLERNYDVREVPQVYTHLQGMVARDPRVSLAFVGNPERLKERSGHIQTLISESYKAKIDVKLKSFQLSLSSADFPVLMAELKCDNGIAALDYDLFAMARDNLEEAVALRSRYPRAEAYLGKVIALTSRTPDDQRQAMEHFVKAIQYDTDRGAFPDPHLQRALLLIAENNAAHQEEIRKEMQTYVALYQREHKGSLPENMVILYDYFALEGEMTWYVAPTNEVSTRYAGSLNVNSGGPTDGLAPKQIVEKATEGGSRQPAVVDAGDSAKVPAAHKKNTSGTVPPQ